MNKKIGAGIAAAVVLVTGVLGTSYYMGGKLQQDFTNAAAQWSRDDLKIQITSYERGAFSSAAKTVWTLDQDGDPVQFTAEHKISHGPLPMGHAAQINTLFHLPDDADPGLKAALNGRAPVQLLTKVGWGHSTSNLMTSPPVKARVNDSDMDWGGMTIQWDMPSDMKAIKGTASIPALQFKDEEGSMSLEKACMRFDVLQPKGQQFWIGPMNMAIDKVTTTHAEPDSLPSSIQGLSLDSDTVLKTDTLEMTLKGGIKSAQMQGKTADDLVWDLSLRNIDAAWLNHVMELSQKKSPDQEQTDSEDDGSDDAESPNPGGIDLRQAMLKTISQALARKPEIEIKRLAMRTPEGVSEFAATLQYLGDGENLNKLPTDLKLTLKTSLPKPVMESMITARKRNQLIEALDEEDNDYSMEDFERTAKIQAAADIQMLQKSGIFEDKSGLMSTQIVYEAGMFQVNGKPLDGEGTAMLFGTLTD
ncbi:YdgA family protein [Comamonas aquatilis]|uniref:YdgA family protein n=1 Tax=Comamonas aquatilis TaxID=1778406 RepID=UPI0039EF8DB0